MKKVLINSIILIIILLILVPVYQYLEPRLPFILYSGGVESTYSINESKTKGVFVSEYKLLHKPVIRLNHFQSITPIEIWSERLWTLGTMEKPINIRALDDGINYKLHFIFSDEDFQMFDDFIHNYRLTLCNSDVSSWGFTHRDFFLSLDNLDKEILTVIFCNKKTNVIECQFSIIKQ